MKKVFKSKNTPYDDEEKALMEAFENGNVEVVKVGSNMDAVLESTLEAIKDSQRKMYSFRLPIKVMDRIKAKAEKAGVPYQKLVCSALVELSK